MKKNSLILILLFSVLASVFIFQGCNSWSTLNSTIVDDLLSVTSVKSLSTTEHIASQLDIFWNEDFRCQKNSQERNLFSSDPSKSYNLQAEGLNTVRHADLGFDNLFVGRSLKGNSADPSINPNGQWGLTLLKFNWEIGKFDFYSSNTNSISPEPTWILNPTDTPIPIPGTNIQIVSAYDPSILIINDRIWIAFECAGYGMGTSTCVGLFDKTNFKIDPNSLQVLVLGMMGNSFDSASVPKFLTHRLSHYLYWTVVHINQSGEWTSLSSRGIEIEERSVNGRLGLHFKDRNAPIYTNDPKASDVWTPISEDKTRNTVADLFDLQSNGDVIYAVGSVGGNDGGPNSNCLSPGGTAPGCYRLKISRSHTPLGYQIFNYDQFEDHMSIMNGQEYSMFFKRPSDNQIFLFGQFLSLGNHPEVKHPGGYRAYPLPPVSEVNQNVQKLWSEDFITKIYQISFNRTVDPSGRQTWLAIHQKNALNLDDIVQGIVFSEEYYRNLVNWSYQVVLNRNAEPEGIMNWLPYLKSNGILSLISQHTQSIEFQNNPDLKINSARLNNYIKMRDYFISETYLRILGRSPDEIGFKGWKNFWDANKKDPNVYQKMVKAFYLSPEFKNKINQERACP